MKRWLLGMLAALLVIAAPLTVQAEEMKMEYIGGVVLRTLPKGNEAPDDGFINVGYMECSMPYLLLGQTTTWQLGVEGGTAPYDIELTLWHRALDATDRWYWLQDEISLGNQRAFTYVFQEAGTYFWQVTITDSQGQTLVFQSKSMQTATESDESDAQTAAGKVNQIVSQIITPSMSEHQRALALHDWLIYNANYDYTYTWYIPEGVLLYGSGVCESYAKAYQMLCTAAGLKCIYVSGYGNGGSHGWNLVQVDGKWYHVDVTWDDPGTGGYERHDYFLLTDEEMGRDHDWNMVRNGDMIVPGAEDDTFELGEMVDYDFSFTNMEEYAAAFSAMVKAGERRQCMIGLYEGEQNSSVMWALFGNWINEEGNPSLRNKGWCYRYSRTGDFYIMMIEWNSPVEYVRVHEDKVLLDIGEERRIYPADYYPAKDVFSWTSSDPSVVQVSALYSEEEGLVAVLTGVAAGHAVVTVTSRIGKTDSIEVTVMPAYTPAFNLIAEPDAENVRLAWQSIPGITEYHIMRAQNGQEECMTVVEATEALLTCKQLPANVQQEIWIVGQRVVDGQVVAEYSSERLLYGEDRQPVEHILVQDAAVAPTCTEAGQTEGTHCERCGLVIIAQETIPALGHDEVVDAAVAATCTEAGKTEGTHCERCGLVIIAQETIPALGHDEMLDAAVDATCNEPGMTEGKHCGVCGVVLIAQMPVPPTGAHLWDEGVITLPPTSETTGIKTYTCKACGNTHTETLPAIEPEGPVTGDANEDGVADLDDVLLMLQFDAGWHVDINEKNADVNSSGVVDCDDVLMLLRTGLRRVAH